MTELDKEKNRKYFRRRLLGFKTMFNNQIFTEKETFLVSEIIEKVNDILNNFNESSSELGFKAINISRFCNKKAIN